MKKLLFLIIFLIVFETAYAQTPDTKNWYTYNGYSTIHNYSLLHPSDWQAVIISNDLQEFSPKGQSSPKLIIKEFEGVSFAAAIAYFTDKNTPVKEITFKLGEENIVAKEAAGITFIKRGSLIIALEKQGKNQTLNLIYDSFKFKDEWKSFNSPDDKYSFIYPSKFKVNKTDGKVEVTDNKGDAVFAVRKVKSLDQANILRSNNIAFHGIENVSRITLLDEVLNREYNLISIKNGENYFLLTDDYYDSYILEMLESFEFFGEEIGGTFTSFQYFSDVKDDHPNVKAVNNLAEKKILNGYEDGTFKPDNEINRAELVKIVVATVAPANSDSYNNCFKDVKTQWYAPYICYAKAENWVFGYEDNSFKPEKSISQAEAMKIIFEILFDGKLSDNWEPKTDLPAEVDLNEWYGKYFIFAANLNLVDDLYPLKNITRKEIAEMIYRSLKLKKLLTGQIYLD
ncbi:hypothetical protein A3I58_00845 [Candidatus Peregrinibacteria bacterium RIFCSPLOWO2_02_FULL_39_10]|nr:MAG: hypothetical protein A3I58_00845 [Candidatus Peregrinibacteria bacterium RIFCSPLOWO2_02_FULL_39_10]